METEAISSFKTNSSPLDAMQSLELFVIVRNVQPLLMFLYFHLP